MLVGGDRWVPMSVPRVGEQWGTLPYQALDDLEQLLHDHSDALVPQESADGLEMWGAHKIPVGAIDVAVGNVEGLEDKSQAQ